MRGIQCVLCAAGGHNIERLTVASHTITMIVLERQHGISLQAGAHEMSPDASVLYFSSPFLDRHLSSSSLQISKQDQGTLV